MSRKAGMPPIEIDLETFRQLCQLQCTELEIAGFFKVSRRTIIRRLKEPEFKEAWEYGKAHGRASLRRLQWKHAQGEGSSAVQMTIHLSKHWLGEIDKSVTEHQGKLQHEHKDAGARDDLISRISGLAARRAEDQDPSKLN